MYSARTRWLKGFTLIGSRGLWGLGDRSAPSGRHRAAAPTQRAATHRQGERDRLASAALAC
eukprot:15060726-Heterocapsa_arctica.AAC.1